MIDEYSRAAPWPWSRSEDHRPGQFDGRAAAGLPRPRRLRVLLVSHSFPPLNVIGSVRVGKFASYLHEAGHDLRVITAPAEDDRSLAVEVPADRVAYVDGRTIDQVLDGFVGRVRDRLAGIAPEKGAATGAAATDGAAAGPESSGQTRSRHTRSGLMTVLARHYYALLRIPDARAGWIGAAASAGYGIVREWRPDVVFASAPPYSALIAAARIARACRAPWIAELRDLWADNTYYAQPAWRRRIDRVLEARTLRSAAGLVTVTPRWAEFLQDRYRQPVACILNGYVEADFPAHLPGPPPGEVVSILYTGGIYRGYRDPSALFRAIALLGGARQCVAVHFYGPLEAEVCPLASAHGVADRVFVHDPVPHKAALALQAAADALLLLQWNDERDAGNIPAKFFEYLGARRPILLLGYEHGDLAGMIRERAAGLVANDPAVIAGQLRAWIAQKPAGIAAPAQEARAGATRVEQYAKLERFLTEAALRA